MGRAANPTPAAAAVGPRRRARPLRWTDELIEEWLCELIEAHGGMPTRRVFEAIGAQDLWAAIKRSGGSRHWASRLGTDLAPAQQRRTLKEAEALEQARAVVAAHGHLPHTDELRRLGYPKLAVYLMRHGGVRRFRDRHDLP